MSVERKINYAGEKNKPKEMTFPEEKKQKVIRTQTKQT